VAKDVIIDHATLGENHPCFIIAEGCDNHLGNLEAAKEMVRQAKLFGADAIKFQHHLPDEEMIKDEMTMSDNFTIPLYDFLQQYALSLDQHHTLFEYCKKIGILYLCTPFSLKAAEELNEMGVSAFKIGSGEFTDIPTLKKIAAFGKPMILSTGMSTDSEIEHTVKTLWSINEDIILMNCTSEYPPIYSDINLGNIRKMKKRYGLIVGHSDHTPDIYTSIAAVAQGAKLIEKHFILDKKQPGPDQSVSIDSFDFYQLVQGVRKVEQALGSNKQVFDREQSIRQWARRSVVSITNIPKGTVITEDMVWTKRPGTGIPAKDLSKIVGKKTQVDIPKDHLIQWGELKK